MSRRCLAILFLFGSALGGMAQAPAPVAKVDLAEAETIVGQPLVLRIKILVPTWMPQPPEFPSLDLPGLIVRLPERAGGPISESVDGETWSGVQRAYRIYPVQPGVFDIPAQTIRVTYADPDTTKPETVELTSDPIRLTATVPDAASGLDPLVLATGFTLEAETDEHEDLTVGDAVVRTVTAKISGTTPILIPALTPAQDDPGLRAYPDEAVVSGSEDRGVLSGSRVERTTYLATAEGAYNLPAIEIDWYNLDTRSVETAKLPAVSLSVAPGATEEAPARLRWNWAISLWLAFAACAGAGLWRLKPRIAKAWLTLKTRWQRTERYAHSNVLAAIRTTNLGEAYSALSAWSRFYPSPDMGPVQDALAEIGKHRFATEPNSDETAAWRHLATCYRQMRRDLRRSATRRSRALPPLNPFDLERLP